MRHKMQHRYDVVANLGPYLDGTPALSLRSESFAQVSLISNHLSAVMPAGPSQPNLSNQFYQLNKVDHLIHQIIHHG